MNNEVFTKRRDLRSRFERADRTIEKYDRDARSRKAPAAHFVPPIDATPEALAVSSTAEMTVNVEWLAYLLDDAWRQGRASMHLDAREGDLAAAVAVVVDLWSKADSEVIQAACAPDSFGANLVSALNDVVVAAAGDGA
jgi:hypothetical protein